jgi:hypothetical protein
VKGNAPLEASSAWVRGPEDGFVDDWDGKGGRFLIRGNGPELAKGDPVVAVTVGASLNTLGFSSSREQELMLRLDEGGWWRDRWSALDGGRARVVLDFATC